MIEEKKMQLIDPHKELFRWGPAPGMPFYTSSSDKCYFDLFPKKYAPSRLSTLILLFRGGQLFWIHDKKEFFSACKEVYYTWMATPAMQEKIYQAWKKGITRTNSLLLSFSDSLARLDNKAFLDLWQALFDEFCDVFTDSVPFELANYGTEEIINELLRAEVPAEEVGRVMEVITAPEQPSFYQREEIALWKTSDLIAHQQQYYWLSNGYGQVEVLPVSFFKKRKAALDHDPEEEILRHIDEVKKKKEACMQQYRLSEKVLQVASFMAKSIVWQDERKEWMLQLLNYEKILLEELARRSGVPFEQLLTIGYHEAAIVLEGRIQDLQLPKRGIAYGYCLDVGSRENFFGEEAVALWESYLPQVQQETLAGIVASKGRGNVRGKVRMVKDPYQTEFAEGDILVASMTSPEFVFLMKKAAAIVTDEGGITSHAAIVSRELKKPCIIGTKVATRVLHDGDIVEVDTETGTIKQIGDN